MVTSKKQKPLVVCIILNWNGMSIMSGGKPILDTCLRTLMATKYENFKVLVVDASSQDNSMQHIRSNFKGINTLEVDNIGWTYGNNMGAREAYAKYPELSYITFLNDDLEFTDPLWLDKLVDAAEKDVRVGIAGAKLLHDDGSIDNCGAHVSSFGMMKLDTDVNTSRYVQFISGAAIMVKKEVMEKIGLFDEIYVPFYGDETDYCERARRAGYMVYYVSEASIMHGSQKSTNATANITPTFSKKQIFYSLVRSTYIFVLRYYPHLIANNFAFSFARSFVTASPSTKLRGFGEMSSVFPMTFTAMGDALSSYKTQKIRKLHD